LTYSDPSTIYWDLLLSSVLKIVVIGGGAAGFFGAIRAAELSKENNLPTEVLLLENSSMVLKKVKISGGGRCNVTHNCFEVKTFCQNYPRGSKELISPFQKFQAQDTVKWFEERGVQLVAEEDGRMFPDTDTSETIIQCFLSEVDRLGVSLLLNHSVQDIEKLPNGRLKVLLCDKDPIEADRVLIATGSAPAGYTFAKSLGHSITELAPSLFSFKIEHPLLAELSGLSFPNTKLQLNIPEAPVFKQNGPTLITHWGLSGPAILKLSAWAAREMMHSNYKAVLTVNWMGFERMEEVQALLLQLKEKNIKSQVKNIHPSELPKRFWIKLLDQAKILRDITWADISKKQLTALAENIFSSRFDILGKNRFKDEFVECGGVSLKEIDFKTMQSKLCPGVYFAGELLDIDGITGGFNFQNAWTTSWLAGTHMVQRKGDTHE
jgi:predicted Rossmann fold flavoprotein